MPRRRTAAPAARPQAMPDLVHYEVTDGVAVLTIDNPPVNALGPRRLGGDRRGGRARARRPERRRHRPDRRGHDVRRRRRHQDLQAPQDPRGLARALGRHPRAAEAHRGRHQAARRRDSRQRARRRPRARDGLPLPRRRRRTRRSASPRCSSASSPAPAARSGCRGWPAPALALEMCTRRQAGAGAEGARRRHRRSRSSRTRRPAVASAIAFANGAGDGREMRRTREIADPARGPSATGLAACDAARARPRELTRGAAAPFAAVDAIEAALTLPFDAGSRPRARAVRRLRRLDRVEGAAAPVLRRARGREGPRRPEGHADAATSGAPRSSAPARWAAASR